MITNGYSITSPTFFSEEEKSSLQIVPEHVAIIMDGNRRWEKKQSNSSAHFSGHWAGAQNLRRILQAAAELNIKRLTVFGFSTENWQRSSQAVEAIFTIILKALHVYQDELCQQGVRLKLIGDISAFPPKLARALEQTVELTANGNKMELTIALNYGGRDELVRAIKKMAYAIERAELSHKDINEKIVSAYLDTKDMPDPDLLIRTSGEMRLSNFLLWQIAYTEFYATATLWPDFSPKELLTACLIYQSRARRMGQ